MTLNIQNDKVQSLQTSDLFSKILKNIIFASTLEFNTSKYLEIYEEFSNYM